MEKKKTKKASPRLGKIKIEKRLLSRIAFVVLTFIAVGFLFYRFKDKFIAGMVNNRPIFRFQLAGRLYSQYGRQILEDLIVERLIYQEAGKKKIGVTKAELEEEIRAIEATLGEGADLDSVLALQGINRADFENQVRLQVLVKKILEPEVGASDEEINAFIEENRDFLTATEEAELVAEAKDRLINQKVSERLNSWISELLQQAKISRFVR